MGILSQIRVVAGVGGFALLMATAVDAQADRLGAVVAARRPAPTNAAGQPVRDEAGAPRNYRADELRTAAPDPASAWAGPAATPSVATLARWGYAAFGAGIGLSGIVSAPNGSTTEIYLAGSTGTFGGDDYWYALRYSNATGHLEETYVSDHVTQGIRRIALARVAGQVSPNIVVALTDGTVRVYAQSDKRLLSSSMGPCGTRGGLQAFTTADLDGNGSDELVSVCGDQTLIAYGPGYTAWGLAGVGGSDVAAGQMDDDPAIEIATTSGKVTDAATHTVQWNWASGFGAHLQSADVDGDGRDELIAAESWYIVWAYDVETQLPKWSIPTSLDIGAILVADIDADGVMELLMGDGQWGRVHAYDTVTQLEEWSIANPEHGVTNIAVADIDDDGTKELLWGAGATSTGPDHLYVADWQASTIVWQNEDLVGPFVGPQVGDLDGDGIPEIVAASFQSNAGYASGRIVVLDSRTLSVRGISPGVAGGSFGWTGVHDLKLRDVNGDGRLDVVVATDWLYDGLIEAYSFSTVNTFTKVWTNATRPTGAPFHSVDVADVDGDGNPEVIGGVGREHTGASGVYIYAYDLASGVEKWHTLQIGDYWSEITDLVVADTDGDGATEFAGMVAGGDVEVFDGATHSLEAIIGTLGASLTTFDSASGIRLLIGDTSGRASVRAFDGVGYPEVVGFSLGSNPLDGLAQASSGAWWVGSGGTLRRFAGATLTFESADYGAGFGRTLAFFPGRPGVLSAGRYGLHGFLTAP